MRDANDGAPRLARLQNLTSHDALRLRVERRGWLIEHEDRRVTKDGAHKTYAFLFAGRQAAVVIMNWGVETLGELVGAFQELLLAPDAANRMQQQLLFRALRLCTVLHRHALSARIVG